MNCLFLATGLASIGGMQRRDRLLVKAIDSFLGQSSGQLHVLSLNDPPLEPLHEDLRHLQVSKVVGFNANRVRYCLSAIRAFRQAEVVFYGLLGLVPLVFFQAAFSPQSKRFLLVHGTEVWQKRRGPYSLAVRQMSAVVAISKYTLERYRQVYQVPAAQTGFVLPNSLGPNPLDSHPFVDTDQKLRSSHPKARLLSVARLAAEEQLKGIDAVIRALPRLLNTFPDLEYIVIGDGSDRPRLESLAQQLGVAHIIQFRGFVSQPDLEHEYRRCTLYVMPSASEGFGLVYIEAMAHGKPVVAARAGGAPEVVEHGITGMLVEYGNVGELVDVLAKLLGDPELRQRMGRSGAQRVREKYTFEAYCQRTAQLLSELLRE